MDIPTHKKGDIAVGCVMADLLKRGFNVFMPVSTHACHYDLVATFIENGVERLLRVQVKYNTFQRGKYADKVDPFDLFAVYYPEFDRILYASFDTATGKAMKVSHQIPNSATPFFWWEDFVCPISVLRKKPKKRKATELGHTIKLQQFVERKSKITATPAELQRLLWKRSLVALAKEFGVSDKALGKRVDKFGLIKPPTGYWAHCPSKRLAIRKKYRDLYQSKMKELLAP